jgi:hypothetical protein
MSRRSLATTLALLGTLVAAPSALAAGPTAIGVDSDGVSYVGFGTAGPVQRIVGTKNDSTGEPDRLSSWGTPGTGAGQLGAAVAIDVAPGPNGNVYVLDANRRVSSFTKSGVYVGSTQLSACSSGYAPEPGVYGGLEIRASEDGDGSATVRDVYVAHPCANEIERLNPTTLAVTDTVATTYRPGHVTVQRFASAPSGTNAVFVADPAGKRVVTYAVDGLAPVSGGVRTYGFTPSDLYVDASGVLFVGDVSANLIRQYGPDGADFRDLGGTGAAAGQLNSPQAFDVFGNYSDYAGNLFIADTGNSRVQRWNSFGFTYWTAATTAGGGTPAAAPANTARPAVTGDPNPGATLACSDGTWTNSPTGYAKTWLRNGSTAVGSGGSYAVSGDDVGQAITCRVTATNATGSAQAVSTAVTPAWHVPDSSGTPQIQGTAQVGQQLTGTQGSWAWAPTGYTYAWRRDGAAIPGATGTTYTLTSADAGHAITFAVTASNPAGQSTAVSAAVTPPVPATPVAAPTNTARPGIQGTPVVGSTLTGTPGSWTGSPSFTYGWRRDGSAIAGATGTTYALVAADAGHTISFAVTATNAGGSAGAVSDGVAVTAAPATPSTKVGVTINGGAEATSTPAVSLRIREPAGATAVVISNDGSFDNASQVAVAADDTYAWRLDARGSERRARVVYVRFVGSGIDQNQTFSDDILLDTTAPTVTTAKSAARSTASTATLRVAATDTGSGVSTIQYAKAKSTKGAKTLKPSKARSVKVRPKNARWVRAIDVAGNASKWKRVAYKAAKRR